MASAFSGIYVREGERACDYVPGAQTLEPVERIEQLLHEGPSDNGWQVEIASHCGHALSLSFPHDGADGRYYTCSLTSPNQEAIPVLEYVSDNASDNGSFKPNMH